MNLVRVTVNDVERHMELRHKVLVDKSWNDELRIAERFFKFAVERDYLARNPVSKIGKHRVVKHSVDFYKILLYTGMRDGEARHLQWQDVVLDAGQEHIRIRSTEVHLTKNRRDRVVPLCSEAVEIFQRLMSVRVKSSPFVFTGRTGGPRGPARNTWRACLDRIEKETGVRIEKGDHMTGMHMFRHTFATNALASGVGIRTVQDWLGHSTILMT
jgi:integrase